MPIDASIPLSVRNPEIAPPGVALGQILSLQDMMQRRRLNEEHLRASQLENQAREREIKAQEAYSNLMNQHSSIGEDGVLKTDTAAVAQGLNALGFGHEGQKVQREARADLHATMAAEEQRLKTLREKNGMIGSLIGSIPFVNDWTKPPEEIEAAKTKATEGVRTAVAQAVSGGLLPRETAQQILSTPYSPELEGKLKQLQVGSMSTDKQIDTFLKNQDEIRKGLKFPEDIKHVKAQTAEAEARTPGITADADRKVIENLGGRLAAATSQEEYDHIRDVAPKKHADTFPDAPEDGEKWEDFQKRVAKASMTAKERATAEGQESARAERERHNKVMEGIRRANAGKEDRVDRHQARTLFNRLSYVEEPKLNRDRRRLGNAIASAQSAINGGNLADANYIDRLGNTKNLTDAAKDNKTSARNLVEDMVARYQGSTDELKQLISDKNEAGIFLKKKPSVTTEEAHAKLDEGDRKLFGTPEPVKSPPPPQAPKARPKPTKGAVTGAEVQGYAKKLSIPYADALEKMAQSGFDVSALEAK
jgi:hypothetical protein